MILQMSFSSVFCVYEKFEITLLGDGRRYLSSWIYVRLIVLNAMVRTAVESPGGCVVVAAAAAATTYVPCIDGAFPPLLSLSLALSARPPAPDAASSSGMPRDRWAYLCALRAASAAGGSGGGGACAAQCPCSVRRQPRRRRRRLHNTGRRTPFGGGRPVRSESASLPDLLRYTRTRAPHTPLFFSSFFVFFQISFSSLPPSSSRVAFNFCFSFDRL